MSETNQHDIDKLIIALGKQLRQINQTLDIIQAQFAPEPDFRRPIEQYPHFDWASIGATVLARDDYGATVVSWREKIWKRRAPDNKYGACIWFSRMIGKEGDQNQYASLIAFEEISLDVEPLGNKALNALRKTANNR